ncbi:MAG TPA: glycosyltransferase family 39 protein [Bacteroidota bacterium]|nr:glycosyltransferase family 39 protein [Bacteroidota bacterium]
MNQQSSSSRFSYLAVRTGFLLAGLLILATIVPHRDPWRMMNVLRVINPPLFIDVHPAGMSWNLRISEFMAAVGLAAGFLIPVIAVPSLRTAFVSFKNKKTYFFSAILALEFFLFTLIPVSNDYIHDARSVMLFLMMGSLGVMYLWIGLIPGIAPLLSIDSLRQGILGTYNSCRWIALESPLVPFLVTLFLIEFALTNAVSYYVFEHIPHVNDSVAQLFQAKIFATGNLTAPTPPHKEFFEYIHMISNGQWYSQYPPGHPFLLMLGVLVGAPWIVNPLLGSMSIIALYFLGAALYGKKVGRLSAILGILSPFVLFMSSGFMNHTGAMFFFILFAFYFVKLLHTTRFLHGALSGAALGMLVTIRPYSAAALASVFLLYGLYCIMRRPGELWAAGAGFVLALLVFTGLLLTFNSLTNGNPLVFGYETLHGARYRPGLGSGLWGGPHTIARGLLQSITNLNGLNKYLFDWPVPSLLGVLVLFVSLPKNVWDYILVGTFGAVVVAYFFFWFQDWCFGPRFLFEASSLLLVLTARGIERIPLVVTTILGFLFSLRRIRIGTFFFLCLLVGIGLGTNIPPHLGHYGDSYWDVNGDVLTAVRQKGIKQAIVFTRTNFGDVFSANSPLLDEELIFARDFGERNSVLMKLFPRHAPYLAVGSDIRPYKQE